MSSGDPDRHIVRPRFAARCCDLSPTTTLALGGAALLP
jgi:hypothetical protein